MTSENDATNDDRPHQTENVPRESKSDFLSDIPELNSPQISESESKLPSESDQILSLDTKNIPMIKSSSPRTLMMVETAFLASTASLIWLINYYFPLGPLLRIFFPVPIALIYLRWGHRAAWMSALISGLLLSVLMGPTRSILFFIPYGLLGVQLGFLWKRQAGWFFSISTGAVIGSLGFFFRFLLLSILLGEDLWVYLTTQMTDVLEWIFLKLGLLIQPNLFFVQAIAIGMVIFNNFVYLFVVHLVSLLLLDRLGNPISRPPKWVQVLLDYENGE